MFHFAEENDDDILDIDTVEDDGEEAEDDELEINDTDDDEDEDDSSEEVDELEE